MKRYFLILILLMSTVISAVQILPTQAASDPHALVGQDAQSGGLRVLESTADYVVLELTTPDYETGRQTLDTGSCDVISVPGYAQTGVPGSPRLPTLGTAIAVPPHASLTLTVVEDHGAPLDTTFSVCPVAQPIVEMAVTGEVELVGTEAVQDPAIYGRLGDYPGSLAEIYDAGFVRGQRVAQISFYPFQFSPSEGRVTHHKRIVVRVEFGHEKPNRPIPATTPQVMGTSRYGAIAPPDGTAPRVFKPEQQTAQRVPAAPEANALGGSLTPSVLNAGFADEWLTTLDASQQPVLTTASGSPDGTDGPRAKLYVETDGIYRLTYFDLLTAGINPDTIDPRTLRLHTQGQEVAIRVTGESDGRFDGRDSITFYGQQIRSRYTDRNVYWLSWGGEPGARVTAIDGQPSGTAPALTTFEATRRIEKNAIYQSLYASGADEDHWYWDYVYASGSPASKSFTFTVDNLAPADDPDATITVRGLLQGYRAYPRHHTQVFLNGQLVDDGLWYSTMTYEFEGQLPASALVEGENTLTVVAGADSSITQDILYVNWFEVDYRRPLTAANDALAFSGAPGTWTYRLEGYPTGAVEIYDVTAPAAPALIANAAIEWLENAPVVSFEATTEQRHDYVSVPANQGLRPAGIEMDQPSDLLSSANGADYIIITHGDFYEAVLPLAALRAGQGMRTAVVKLQDVYDEFSYGVMEPEAIRDFLAYAYTYWAQPAPTYVLLVGDGHFDFKDYRATGEPVFIPPYLADVDYWIGEAAVDNRYVCVSGDDRLPDMAIGRLPVKTSQEAAGVVSKIIHYEENPAQGGWARKILFLADNPDTAGDFYAYSDAVADAHVPKQYSVDKVYYRLTHPTVDETRASLFAAVRDGRTLVNYVGHGSIQAWASEGFLRVGDVPSLDNLGREPFVVTMACLDGQFTQPSPPGSDYSSTTETLLRAAEDGSIAGWAATGLGLAAAHDYLNKGLFDALFTEGIRELGPATVQAKLFLASQTRLYFDQIDEYTLFGDPALRLKMLLPDLKIRQEAHAADTLSAGDQITYTLTYSNEGEASARDVIIESELSAALLQPVAQVAGEIGATTASEGPYAWALPELEIGEFGTITLTGTVGPEVMGVLTNVSTIATSYAEEDLADNISATEVPVGHRCYLPVIVNPALRLTAAGN